MGFVETAYNVLSLGSSLASWPSSGSTLREELAKNPSSGSKIIHDDERPRQQQQQQVISLDCKSWLLDRLLGRSDKAKNATKNKNNLKQYERPPKWKQAIRKCRAEARKVRSSCYGSVCADPQPLHHYKTESYERNFDRGREYWADLPFLDISPFCSPGSISHRMHSSFSIPHGHGWMDLHQEHQQQGQGQGQDGDDRHLVWQRSDAVASV